jgi:phenylalanyl-tRNA synthetase beta chain
MVVLTTSLNQLYAEIGKKLTVQQLEELLFQAGFEVESIQDDSLTIDITTDRLDVASSTGLARFIGGLLQTYHQSSYTIHPSSYKVVIDSSVKKVRPYTVSFVAKDIPMTEQLLTQLIAVQEKLHTTLGKKRTKAAIGIYPLDSIQWPVRFTAKKPEDISFIPLGDSKPMTALELLEQHPTGKEYAHLLANQPVFPLFIDSAKHILSLPPIINSQSTGKVTPSTTQVFVEVSGFDLATLTHIQVLLATLFADAGATLHQVRVQDAKHSYKLVLRDQSVSFVVAKLNEHLGTHLNAQQIKKHLQQMNYFDVALSKNEKKITAKAPPYRYDIWHAVDIYDDVLRSFGIQNIELRLPHVATTAQLLPLTQLSEDLEDFCVGLHLQEVKTLVVTDKNIQLPFASEQTTAQAVFLGSTQEKSINMVRAWLTPELLHLLSNNKSVPTPHAIFEIGDCVLSDLTVDTKCVNRKKVAFAQSGEQMTFTTIRQLVDALCVYLNVSVTYKPTTHPLYIDGRCAQIIVDGVVVGVVGEVHPKALVTFGIEFPTSCAELDVELLCAKKLSRQ